jgi:diacylglycerol O-acyltransferase
MPLADAFFLINESSRTPMHVGGLNLYTLPEGVDDATFLAGLGEILSYDGEMRRPFGEKLKIGTLGPLGPVHWQSEDMLDMEYHIRHSALAAPGRYRELFALISRLHSTLLDRSRPLWEMHLIEGLQDRQFATYFKVHHCAIDGVGAMHLTNSMLSGNPRDRVTHSPFSMEAYRNYRDQIEARKPRKMQPREDEVRAVTEALRAQLGGTVNVAGALRQYAKVWLGSGGNLSVPWYRVPRTSLTTRVTGARRFVAQSWPFARVRAVGKALDATLNDTVLAMCAGALRKHLQEQGDLPKQSLKAMAPISLRTEGDFDSANAVGFITADLGTNVKDPQKRLRVIKDSMDAGKAQLAGMSKREVEIYTMITQAPMVLTSLSGLASRLPAFSTVVSNVPGPRQRMYWNGARLDGLYPVSVPFDGFALNITLVSNHDNLDFGIVACRRSVPHVQRLIDYMEDALVELEEVAGLAATTTRGRAKAKSSGGSGSAKVRKQAGAANKATAGTKAKSVTTAKTKAKAKTKTKTKAKTATRAKTKTQAKAAVKASAGTGSGAARKPKVTAKQRAVNKARVVRKAKAAVKAKTATKTRAKTGTGKIKAATKRPAGKAVARARPKSRSQSEP